MITDNTRQDLLLPRSLDSYNDSELRIIMNKNPAGIVSQVASEFCRNPDGNWRAGILGGVNPIGLRSNEIVKAHLNSYTLRQKMVDMPTECIGKIDLSYTDFGFLKYLSTDVVSNADNSSDYGLSVTRMSEEEKRLSGSNGDRRYNFGLISEYLQKLRNKSVGKLLLSLWSSDISAIAVAEGKNEEEVVKVKYPQSDGTADEISLTRKGACNLTGYLERVFIEKYQNLEKPKLQTSPEPV